MGKKSLFFIMIGLGLIFGMSYWISKKKNAYIQSDETLLTGRWAQYYLPKTGYASPEKQITLIQFFEKDQAQGPLISVRSLDLNKKQQQGFFKGRILKLDDAQNIIEIEMLECQGQYFMLEDNWDFSIKRFRLYYEIHYQNSRPSILLYLIKDKFQARIKLGVFYKEKSST